jgi:hypothetical protein
LSVKARPLLRCFAFFSTSKKLFVRHPLA